MSTSVILYNMTTFLQNMNTSIFIYINQFAGKNSLLDNLIIFIAEYLPYFFILFLLYLWFSKKDFKKNALFSGYSATLGIFIDFLISTFYFHPRPFMDKIGTTLTSHASDSSFPSDHTTFMLSIAFTLLYFKETRVAGIILSVIGLLGGMSRIFTGVHYPFDIFGSIIVACVSAFIIFTLKNKFEKVNMKIINIYYLTLNKIHAVPKDIQQ